MSEKKTRIKNFNISCKNNKMFKMLKKRENNNATNQSLTINLKEFKEIFKENGSLMELGVILKVGRFSEMCKKSIKNYKKLIQDNPNIENNKTNTPEDKKALENFLTKEKEHWGLKGYLKHRMRLEKKENNKNLSNKDNQLSEAVKEMNGNKKIIAEGISRFRIDESVKTSSNTVGTENNIGLTGEHKNRVQQVDFGASQNKNQRPSSLCNSGSPLPKTSEPSQNRTQYTSINNTYRPSYGTANNTIGPNSMASPSYSNLNEQNLNMAGQSQYAYPYPSNNNIGAASMASQSPSNLNAQKLNMAMPSQNRTQYTSINNTYRLSYGTANNTVGPGSTVSPSYSNLNVQNQYMAMQSQYVYQPPSGGNTSGGSFHPLVARSDRDSGASSSSNNNSSWPNSNVPKHSRDSKSTVTPNVAKKIPGKREIRSNPSGERFSANRPERYR